ncbi:hypothetical protein ACJMK2_043534 [Sinanodonta woodiana]|uniref:G-protein coupled receptors family 1 profile domain-containing protein n=1 Tax=Sinanodonta woodiana TaxID=1069815 RepID=A0ABD3W0D9_SINWO
MKMESIECTNNYLLKCSTTPATTTRLYEESEKVKEYLYFRESLNIVLLIVFGLITVTGLVGNILTVTVILQHKGIKSITDILVLTLTVTDILFIVFGVLGILDVLLYMFDDLWCRLVDYVTFACSYASMYMLVLISLDRYLALVHPIRSMSFRTKRNCYILILIIWIFILLGNISMLFENPFCPLKEVREESVIRIYYICTFVFEFMLPLLVMCILYGHILKSFHNANIPGVNTTISRVRLISNRRVIKIVTIAMTLLIICRLPLNMLSLYQTFTTYVKNIHMFTTLYWVFVCMFFLNCCINPILYRFHSSTFRNGCREVFRCKT